MISTRRQKNCLVAIGLHGIKAQLLMPESFGILCIAHAQVDMTNDGILWRTVPFTALTIDNIEKVFNVKRIGTHFHTITVPLPRIVWAIGIDFDAVPFRIGQINCFTDIVVGCTGNGQLLVDSTTRPACEIATCR